MKTKYVCFLQFVSENSIKRDLENYFDFKYTCSFQRKVLPELNMCCNLLIDKRWLKFFEILKTTALKTS